MLLNRKGHTERRKKYSRHPHCSRLSGRRKLRSITDKIRFRERVRNQKQFRQSAAAGERSCVNVTNLQQFPSRCCDRKLGYLAQRLSPPRSPDSCPVLWLYAQMSSAWFLNVIRSCGWAALAVIPNSKFDLTMCSNWRSSDFITHEEG